MQNTPEGLKFAFPDMWRFIVLHFVFMFQIWHLCIDSLRV